MDNVLVSRHMAGFMTPEPSIESGPVRAGRILTPLGSHAPWSLKDRHIGTRLSTARRQHAS
jgi:hypothetical protein